MQVQRVFLTGGGGMVGRNILEHPQARDMEFFSPSSKELDLTDGRATLEYVGALRPDVVIHAAGRVGGIHANMAHPVDFLVTNTDLARNVVLAARKAGVKRFINLGSSCMYPRNASNPLSEDLILKGELEPTNEGYALAKIFAARLCQYINREDGTLQYKTLVPANLYGPHDKFDPVHSHLVPAIIHKIHQAKRAGQRSVEIWGDGTARREFLYAGDLADAIFYALESFEGLPEITNIGLGHDYSINEYYAITAEILGWTGDFVHDRSKPVGMARKLVSIEKQQSWGWKAKTSVRDGIAKTYEFYLQREQA